MLNELMSNRALRLAAFAAISLLAVFLLVKTLDTAFGRKANEPINTITVTGTGDAAAVPNIAQITFTVMQSAGTVAEAQQAATAKTDAALAFLKEQGIEDKDVKTLYYNVNPRYEYNDRACAAGYPCPPSGSPTISGYEVSQSVDVKVRDTAEAGTILEGLGSLGIQNISGPNFTVDDDSDVSAEAREAAIEDARAKAKVLARQLGVRLGRVVSFSENSMYPMYAYGKGGGMDAVAQSAPALPVGENETNVTVMITYEIR